ncbi:hypothetical protein D9615_007741 [Tricholomella constricta]|uniref:DUF1996 domain-containing protein n=1 Tax=Tricholomella constricta TaxID=117010 RepID=A0A8H5M0A4_9AGAR|nr:hypothetical protein D9615_007741 [Tricholomella constricta]
MGANNILTTQRLDPVVYPGRVSTHVHSVLGGSNFGLNVTTEDLRRSECTSIPIVEDKSNYWFPHLYFQCANQWQNGTFTSMNGSAMYVSSYYQDLHLTISQDYLFNEVPGYTSPFPDNFRMVSGDPNLRTLDPISFAQQAITFLCLDFTGASRRFNELPTGICPSGIRAQINFPSCWDGKVRPKINANPVILTPWLNQNSDSPDHKSHVAFLSTGPDNGTCNDSHFPLTIPRIFIEVYWNTQVFDDVRHEAMTPTQPFVFSNGDPKGYSYLAGKPIEVDFINGWEPEVLQRAVNECNCNPYGDPSCCAAKGIFTIDQHTNCFITNTFDEATTGTLASLPGNNPVQADCYETYIDTSTPGVLSPVFVYSGSASPPPPTGITLVTPMTSTVAQTAHGTCIRKNTAVPLFVAPPV